MASPNPERHGPPFHPYATPKSLERWESIWPEVYPWTGTPYPSTPSILADLADQNAPLRRPVPYHIPFPTAAHHLQSLHPPPPHPDSPHQPPLHLSPPQHAAAARLRTLHSLDRSGAWLSDILLKIFDDLDVLLFEGRLRGNVHLSYATAKLNPEAKDQTAGVCAPGDWVGGGDRFVLMVNADRVLLDGRRRLGDLVAVLVHEMTHAYLMLWVGNSDKGQFDPSTGRHSAGFVRSIDAVNRTLRPSTGFVTIYEGPREWWV